MAAKHAGNSRGRIHTPRAQRTKKASLKYKSSTCAMAGLSTLKMGATGIRNSALTRLCWMSQALAEKRKRPIRSRSRLWMWCCAGCQWCRRGRDKNAEYYGKHLKREEIRRGGLGRARLLEGGLEGESSAVC